MWWRKENRQLHSLLDRLKWTLYCICNLHRLFPPSMVLFFHGTKGPSVLCTQQRRQMLLYLWTAKEGGKEGRRERELCAFPASPSLQLCAVSRCKVTLSSYMCGLKDYKTERKWMVPFFFSSCIWNSFLSFLGAPSVDWWTTGQRRRKGFLPANPRVQDVLFLLQQLMTP